MNVNAGLHTATGAIANSLVILNTIIPLVRTMTQHTC